jgi:hypothetical protein
MLPIRFPVQVPRLSRDSSTVSRSIPVDLDTMMAQICRARAGSKAHGKGRRLDAIGDRRFPHAWRFRPGARAPRSGAPWSRWTAYSRVSARVFLGKVFPVHFSGRLAYFATPHQAPLNTGRSPASRGKKPSECE